MSLISIPPHLNPPSTSTTYSSQQHLQLPPAPHVPTVHVTSSHTISTAKATAEEIVRIYGRTLCTELNVDLIASLPEVEPETIGMCIQSKYPQAEIKKMPSIAVRGVMKHRDQNNRIEFVRPFIAVAVTWRSSKLRPWLPSSETNTSNDVSHFVALFFRQSYGYTTHCNTSIIHEPHCSEIRTRIGGNLPSTLLPSEHTLPGSIKKIFDLSQLLSGARLVSPYEKGLSGTVEMMERETLEKLKALYQTTSDDRHPRPISLHAASIAECKNPTHIDSIPNNQSPTATTNTASSQEDYAISLPSGPLQIDTEAEPEFSAEAKSFQEEVLPLTQPTLNNSTVEAEIQPPSPQKNASPKSLLESITSISELDIPATVASNVMPEAKKQSFNATQQPSSSSSNLNVSEAKNCSAQTNAPTVSLGTRSSIPLPIVPNALLSLAPLPAPTVNTHLNSQNLSTSGGANPNLKAKKGSCTIL